METQNLSQLESLPLSTQLVNLVQATESGLVRMSFLEPEAGHVPDVSGLASMSKSRIQELIGDLNLTLNELRLIDENANLSASERREADVRQFKRFLDHHRYHVKDEAIFDLFGEGDVLEVYDHRSIQLWRNWTFFKVCPYSLLELLVNDWNTLFARPSWVVDRLMSLMPALFSGETKVVQYDIPEYLLSARRFPEGKGVLFRMKYVAPIFNHVGQPIAIITTGSIEILPEARVGRDVAFI